MKIARLATIVALTVVTGISNGQILDPALLTKPATNSWPTFNGDYSGRRFSTLKQIDQKTVKNLSLAWINRIRPGDVPGSIVGGEGTAAQAAQLGGGWIWDCHQVQSAAGQRSSLFHCSRQCLGS